MTTWSARQIGKWLTEAGLAPADVVHGTALALAATGGADHWSHNPTSVPEYERRGIYALRVDQSGGDAPGDLYHPVKASAALAAMLAANGGSWSWHPVHESGAALAIEDVVRLMLADRGGATGAARRGDYDDVLARTLSQANAYRKASMVGGL